MSGEYYASEEPVNKFYKQYTSSPQSDNCSSSDPKLNELGLKELEKHIKIAESRCNILHDQLDNLKQVYTTNRSNPKTRKLSTLPHQRKYSNGQGSMMSLTEELGGAPNPQRQSSNAIGTDTTGAAVRTINHILNGITDSVNRLSELHVKASESPRVLKGMQDDIGREVVTRSSTAINVDVNLHPRKVPNKKPTSSTSIIKRSLKMDKHKTTSRPALNRIEPTKKYYTKFTKNNNYLVELYHNKALSQPHHSDSDDGHGNKKSHKKAEEEVPPLEIFSRRPEPFQDILRVSTRPETARHMRRPSISNTFYEPPEAQRTEVLGSNSKNYELPTVSSKMKQVAKNYLSGLNFKVIPFCAAMSTTPSHNIGINIQQVMNVIKNRQPFQGISLTLAHNIGLAAEKLHNKPFSALVSRINSNIISSSKCPLTKSVMNYNELQEMAKCIPEDVIEEGDEDLIETPEMKTVYITGPSGDVEVKTRNMPTWMADPLKTEQCTCIIQPNIELDKVSNKYYKSYRTLTTRSVNSQILSHKRRMLKSRSDIKSRPNTRISTHQENLKNRCVIPNQEVEIEDKQNEFDVVSPSLQGKEKSLKLVLTNLHDEFEEINKKYEDLTQKAVTGEQDKVTLQQLEQLEAELSKKEEEITMVMTLYKEVLALKQQVKLLKDKKSQGSISTKEPQDTKTKFKEYNNPEAAFHLTKLLRQIQHYQLRYKTNLECAD